GEEIAAERELDPARDRTGIRLQPEEDRRFDITEGAGEAGLPVDAPDHHLHRTDIIAGRQGPPEEIVPEERERSDRLPADQDLASLREVVPPDGHGLASGELAPGRNDGLERREVEVGELSRQRRRTAR